MQRNTLTRLRQTFGNFFFQVGRSWTLVVFIGAVILLLPNICYPMGPDQSLFAVIGRGLLDGKRLYVDLWDVKPPGIFYFYALLFRIFGPAMWSVGVVDALISVLLCYLTYLFARRFTGGAAAAFGAITTGAWHARGGHWVALQAEPLIVAMVLTSYVLMTRHENSRTFGIIRSIFAGVLFGWAFWIKYVALVFVPLLVFLPFFEFDRESKKWCLTKRKGLSHPIEKITCFVMAFLLVGIGIVSALYVRGGWQPFLQISRLLPPYSLEFVHRYKWSYPVWAWIQTVHGLGRITLSVTALALVVAWRKHELTRVSPIFLGALLSYLAVAGQFRFNSYTFEVCYPFFAVIRGYLAVAAINWFFNSIWLSLVLRRPLERIVPAWALALATVIYAGYEIRGITTRYTRLEDWVRSPTKSYGQGYWSGATWNLPEQEEIVNEILREPGLHTIFVWGNDSLVYLQTASSPPSRFISNSWLTQPWAPHEWHDEIESDFHSHRPEYVVVAKEDVASSGVPDSLAELREFTSISSALNSSYYVQRDLAKFRLYHQRESTTF